jgi:hypothetical protein
MARGSSGFASSFCALSIRYWRMATVKPQVEFEPAPMKIGSGWCVQVTLPYGINPKLGGFKTEEEAREWIARKSAEWLKGYEGGRYA